MCNWLVLALSIVNCTLFAYNNLKRWCIFLECKFVECFWNNIEDWISAKLKVNIKLSKFNKLFGFQENCVDYKFLNNLMLLARFFIYRCKYSKPKPNMLEYFNELNMNKKSEYVIAKRNKSLAEHSKTWRNICDFNWAVLSVISVIVT